MSWGVATQNGVSVSLASIVSLSAGVTEFSPADLFTGGVAGAWYDPSDTSTLFQDSAGTTPVTAVEQPVGLMLDKSQGLVLGSELVTGALSGSTNWTLDASGSVTGGALVINTPVSTNSTQIYVPPVAGTFVAGRRYAVTFTVTRTNGTLTCTIGSAGGSFSITSSGTFTAYLECGGGTPNRISFSSSASAINNFVGSVTALSVKELPGNHASQSTSTSRPVLRARYNLLTYSEQFDNGVWTTAALNAFGSGSVVNTTATLDPIGGNTAEFIQENTTASTTHGLNTSVTLIANTVYTVTCYFKAATRTLAIIGLDSAGGNGARAFFNLSTGSVGTASALGTGTLVSAPTPTAIGNGWYRCQLTAKVDPAATSASLRLSIAETDGVQTYTGNGTSGIYIWGAQLVTGSSAGTYQRIAAATVYDTAGFLPYLAFDGTDDSFGTNSINFTATDKMSVCAGVTKLSDATSGVVAELSANAANLDGAFGIRAPYTNAANEYCFILRGTQSSRPVASGFVAPITNVISAQFDIALATATEEIKARINGVSATLTPAGNSNVGTGNFGTYPLYIGRLGGTSLPLNGRIYGLIVAGKTLSASELSATEAWMNSKTGAY